MLTPQLVTRGIAEIYLVAAVEYLVVGSVFEREERAVPATTQRCRQPPANEICSNHEQRSFCARVVAQAAGDGELRAAAVEQAEVDVDPGVLPHVAVQPLL